MNEEIHKDYENHQLIIRYNGLVRYLDFKYQNEENIMKLVNEMRAEISYKKNDVK